MLDYASLKERDVFHETEIEKYVSALALVYDALLEINLTRGIYQTIFRVKDRFEMDEHGTLEGLGTVIKKCIHPEDLDKFVSAFNYKELKKIYSGRYQKSMEYRAKQKNEPYLWNRITFLPGRETEDEVILCYIMDIEKEKCSEMIEKARGDLSWILKDIYIGIIEVDLSDGSALVIQCSIKNDKAGKTLEWNYLMELFISSFIHPEDIEIVKSHFSYKGLKKIEECGQKRMSVEARYSRNGYHYEWVEISVLIPNEHHNKGRAYIMLREAAEQHLLKSIVDRYVYNNCDYFIYLDAKNNSYKMFSRIDSGTPLPPSKSLDYTRELQTFIKQYIVSEDQEMVIREMQLERVLEVLEKQGEHSFSCGLWDPSLGYTRKKFQFIYYDRHNKKVLFSRTDVTQLYYEQKMQQERLKMALERAQRDPLTGLYNQQASDDFITEHLKNSLSGQAALLFLDLDNFKMVNDTLGHMKGNEFLKHVADSIKKHLSPSDLAGRIGGDEFIVLLTGVSSVEEVEEIVKQMCKSVEQITSERVRELKLSCSIGVSLYPQDSVRYRELYRKADEALYRTKRQGKNGYSFYGQEY